jgi:1,4-alpha-glucan branching enzyme
VVVALNFTPVPREGYRIGAPAAGFWREIFNSDSAFYGGGNLGNGAGLITEEQPWMGYPQSLSHPAATGRRDPLPGLNR